MLDVRGDNRQLTRSGNRGNGQDRQKGGAWLVPSQSGKGRYTVCLDPAEPHCSCPDHEEGGHKCKHIFAVEYVDPARTQSGWFYNYHRVPHRARHHPQNLSARLARVQRGADQ